MSVHLLPAAREPQKLYLMRNDFGLYKIGISYDPERRRMEIQNSSGVPVSIVDVLDPDDAFQAEQLAHQELKELRRCGEWFAFGCDDEAITMLKNAISPAEPEPEPAQAPSDFEDLGTSAEVAIKYRMGIQDVREALAAECCDLYFNGVATAVYEGQIFKGMQAIKIARAAAHSGLTKLGFFRPDAAALKMYIEAIALIRRQSYGASDAIPNGDESEVRISIISLVQSGFPADGREVTASDVIRAAGLSVTRTHQIAAGKVMKKLGFKWRRKNGRTIYLISKANMRSSEE